jgi:NADPH-dependent glutamate synthase beta subunit-like oxidoreductase
MLRYGIPNYRLPKELLDREIDIILSTGIKVHTGVTVGKDITIEQLKDEFDSIYIAIGAHAGKLMGIEGQDAEGVTSAVRLGADKVTIVYRRRKVDMPAMKEEVEGAIAEGVEILDLYTPVKVEKDENNHVKALWIQPQIVGLIKGGRPKPVKANADMEKIDCDIVISAIGQDIETKPFEEEGIPVSKGVMDALNTTAIKDIPGVFSGGDCVSGPATVIRAIAAGKVAAANIDEYLGYNHVITTDVDIPNPRMSDKLPCGRVNMRERDVHDRIKDFELIEIGMTRQEADQESCRCLRCDLGML